MLHLLFIIYHHLHHHRHFLYRKRQNEPDRKAQIVNKNMHSPGATFTCNNGAFFKNYKHKCILKRISRVFISDIFCDFIFFSTALSLELDHRNGVSERSDSSGWLQCSVR